MARRDSRRRACARGDRFVILGENGLVTCVLTLAAARAGAWPVILNARLSDREVETITAHADPRLIAFASDISPDAGNAMRALSRRSKMSIIPGLPPFRLTVAADCEPEPVHGDPARDVGAMIYTSGTTGAPKGVMLSHGNLMHVARNSGYLRGLGPGDLVYGCLPVSHVFGLASVFLGSALYGATNYVVPRFDPSEALRLLRDERLSVFPGRAGHVRAPPRTCPAIGAPGWRHRACATCRPGARPSISP